MVGIKTEEPEDSLKNTSGYKNNIVSGFGEAAAKVSADRPDTYNGDAH